MRAIPTLLIAALALQVTPVLVPKAAAQDVGAVSPVSAPIPLPGSRPLPPDVLRSDNPAVLAMTGVWRFRLTHGQTVNGVFQSAFNPFTASSVAGQSWDPSYAFDNDNHTCWTSGEGFPQWIQVDLGGNLPLTGMVIDWDRPSTLCAFRVEGSIDAQTRSTLAESKTETASVPLTFAPTTVRYVKITVLGVSRGRATVRDCRIHYLHDGVDTVWSPDYTQPPDANAFAATSFDDHDWDNLATPSNWEMAGYSMPTYNSVDDTVGLYRRWVTVPASFAGKSVIWRFDGVFDSAEIFVNGQRAGYHESGFTGFDIDVTPWIKPGEKNLFALRVCKQTSSFDCDTGDYQSLGGIFRATSLIATPHTRVQDLTVSTKLDDTYTNAILQVDARVAGTPGSAVSVDGSLFAANGESVPVPEMSGSASVDSQGSGHVLLAVPVKAPRLWSAEKPNLYYLVLTVRQNGAVLERVEQRFGFRQVDIVNGILLWNGRPIKLTGTCRHDIWPTLGSALGEDQWRTDLALMKAANINAIRTSHYNHAERFMELCDEEGFYVLDEVPFCWIEGRIDDPSYLPYLTQRADETVARDKNRPCVLAWSLGNENRRGVDGQAVLDHVKILDPTRPAFVSQMGPEDYPDQVMRDSHYPSPGTLAAFSSPAESGVPTVITENPHTASEKGPFDYDPGISDLWALGFERIWDDIWKAPTICGSFIWEWQNQGIADKYPDKTRDFYYGPDHLRQENNKGIVDAYRNPKPAYWYVKTVYSPVFIADRTIAPIHGIDDVTITNRYSFTDLKELTCRWTDVGTGDTGTRRISCAPGKTVSVPFPVPESATALHLEFDHPDGSSIVTATLERNGESPPPAPAGLAGGSPLTISQDADQIRVVNNLGSVAFDRTTGQFVSGMLKGPVLNLGQGLAPDPRNSGFLYLTDAPELQNVQVSAAPAGDDVKVTVTGEVYVTSEHMDAGPFECDYTLHPNASMDIDWNLKWAGESENLWESGLKFLVPSTLSTMRWSHEALLTDYPANHPGAPFGQCGAADSAFRSSKRNLHWLSLSGGGSTVVLEEDGKPLIGRADLIGGNVVLFASSEISPPHYLSTDYVADHEIFVTKATVLGGQFRIRLAVGG